MIIASLIEKLIVEAFKAYRTDVEDGLLQIMSNRLLEYQVSEFERNSLVKTMLHRATPVKLKDIYLPMTLNTGNLYSRTTTKCSIKDIFSISKRVTILGLAGCGKSTITKYLFLQCIEEDYKIPIRVELRYFNGNSQMFYNHIVNDIFEFNKLGQNEKLIEKLLNSGKYVFLLDGFDEIESARKGQMAKQISDFTKRFDKNNYLITSRPHSNIDLMSGFTNLEVMPLTDSEIIQFVKKQKLEAELQDKLISTIEDYKGDDYKSFLQNPLLLSMFIITYQTYSSLPPRKSVFYEQVYHTLFTTHDSLSKLSYEREKKSGLNRDDFKSILNAVCFLTYFEQRFIFPPEYIIEKLNLIAAKSKGNFKSLDFVQDLLESLTILIELGIEYTFVHRSLQEYFAACNISSFSAGNKEAFYKKLFNSLLGQKSNISEFSNFYSILEEVDKVELYKYFTIPFLSVLKEKIKEKIIDKKANSELPEKRYYLPVLNAEDLEIEIDRASKNEKIVIRGRIGGIYKRLPYHEYIDNFINICQNDIDIELGFEEFLVNMK